MFYHCMVMFLADLATCITLDVSRILQTHEMNLSLMATSVSMSCSFIWVYNIPAAAQSN